MSYTTSDGAKDFYAWVKSHPEIKFGVTQQIELPISVLNQWWCEQDTNGLIRGMAGRNGEGPAWALLLDQFLEASRADQYNRPIPQRVVLAITEAFWGLMVTNGLYDGEEHV